MSEQEVVYTEVKCNIHMEVKCDTPSEQQRKPRKSESKAPAPFWQIIAGILGILCLVSVGAAVTLAAKYHSCPGCPDQWMAYRHSCYFFSKAKKDWNSSQKYCSAEGSHLLVISDAQEMDLFWVFRTEAHWIGLRNRTSFGWAWEDGSRVNKMKVIFNSPVQHCGIMLKGILQASTCDVPAPWICEKELK